MKIEGLKVERLKGSKDFGRSLLLTFVTFLTFQLFFSGCLYYGQYGPRPSPIPRTAWEPTPPVDPGYFDYAKEPPSPRLISTSDRGGHTIQKLLFPTHTAFLYLPHGVTRAPAVVVLPISNGNYHAKQMAHYLAAYGFICLRFQSRGEAFFAVRNSENPIEEYERLLKTYVLDVLQGIDWLTVHPSVDSERIGVVGTSMGAMIGTIVTGVDPRVKAGVFLLAGGDLTGILFSSKEPSILAVRKRMEDQEDLTREEIRQEVAMRLRPLDPLTYADRVDPKTVLMINAYLDRVIKRRHTMALWKALGKPPMIQLPTGHYSAALFFNYAEHRAATHFQRVLGSPR